MIKSILVVLGICTVCILPTTLEAVTIVIPPIVLTDKQVVAQLVTKYATEYGVSAYRMQSTLACEDNTFEFDRQSEIYNSKGREESYGVAQINLPSHKDISYSQAIDPDFAVRYMAQQFSQGRQSQWSCYRNMFM